MMKAIFLGTLVAASVALGAAHAQVERGGPSAGAIPPLSDQRAGGDQPRSAGAGSPADTGSITPTGRVKPPGAPVGESLGTRPDLERRAQELDRRIRTGICRGC
jgi:hypothetical protein